MKERIVLSFLLLLPFCELMSRPLKMGVVSDIHYLSEQLMDDGEATRAFSLQAGRNVFEAPAILDQVIADYLQSDIEVLLIPGDLTKDGERQSHLDLANKLQALLHKGIRVFVIPGNHDINMPNTYGYKDSTTYRVDNISPSDFETIYAAFGYASAIRRDANSLSYVAELDSDVWLLSLDACRYDEYTDTSITEGRISSETEYWIRGVLKEAAKHNIRVVSMLHHGLVEHLVYQGTFLPQYLIDDWQRLSTLFADNGVKAIFTGHFHSNDISMLETELGNKIYDIETGSLSAYPYPYRFVELTDDGLNVSTKNVNSIPNNPNLSEAGRKILNDRSFEIIKNKLRHLNNEWAEESLIRVADVVNEVFMLHIQGDEVIDDGLRLKIEKVATGMDIPIDLSSESFQLDTYPKDNNVSISFEKTRYSD